MNDHEWELEVRGDYRAVIGYDMYAEHPDGDCQGTIVRLDRFGRGDTEVKGEGYADAGEVTYAWDHYRDMELVERYLRIWFGVVGFDYFDTHDSKYIVLVTEADLKHWGWEQGLAEFRDRFPGRDPAEQMLDEWRAWVNGEVYYIDVQEQCTKQIELFNSDGLCMEAYRETSWETVDSCHGFYGLEYAEEHALDTLNHYAPEGD